MTDLTNSISAKRLILTNEKTEYDALEESFANKTEEFMSTIDDAIKQEQCIVADMVTINNTFDENALANRLQQLEFVSSEFDKKMTLLQAAIQSNNDIADSVFKTYDDNVSQVNALKQSISTIMGKLDNYLSVVHPSRG